MLLRHWKIGLLTICQATAVILSSLVVIRYGKLDEIKYWGFNFSTIWFLGTVGFSLASSKTLWRQNRTIWDTQCGENVQAQVYSCLIALFSLNIIYGISHEKLGPFFTGASRVVMMVPILIGLWKFKGFSFREKAFSLFYASSIPIAICIRNPENQLWFLRFMASIGVINFAEQPLKIFFTKKRGKIDLGVQKVGLYNSIVWSLYAFAIGDQLFSIISPIYAGLYLLTIMLWHRAKP